jgi:glutaminyl-tRNA synthetase
MKMNAQRLANIGIPVGGPVVRLGLPEEAACLATAAPASAAPAAASKASAAVSKAASKPSAAAKGTASAGAAAASASSDGRNFLEKWIEGDLAAGGRCHGQKVMTRFPPEPNGYLHIGHAKAILTNFGLAQKYGGQCNLRFDDTNPETEEVEYVESIKDDVEWICKALNLEQCKNGGKPWRNSLFFASEYFDQMHAYAIDLIKHGKAYVDSQSAEDVQKNRGGGKDNAPGVDSPFRSRSVEENLRLFQEMQDGKHKEGTHLLRAKIDMNHDNMNMRDPPMYRIRFAKHHNTGEKWKVYPIYDFAHGNEDAIEGVTHSICTLEFENHRALYDWFRDNISTIPSKPHQKEFARLEIEGAVTSKRKLLRLVKEGKVRAWDDPRLLTVRGLKRRGVRPEGLKKLCDMVGVTDRNSVTPMDKVEDCFRDDLENISLRRLVVLDPLKVEITSYKGEEKIDGLTDLPDQNAKDNPGCVRSISFSSEIYIDRSDFLENAPEGYFRLSKIGSEVKLRYCYVIKLEEIVKDNKGNVTKLKCSHDPATRDIMPADRKPKVIQWVNGKDCVDAEVRLINNLFLPMPGEIPAGKDFMDYLNPEAWVICSAKAEKSLAGCKQADRFQFERCGYFAPDYDCFEGPKKLTFNRVVALAQSSSLKKVEGNTGASRKDAQAALAAEKDRLKKIPPSEFFRSERGSEFAKYDDKGFPTHDQDGKELTKSAIKKLQKDLEKHEKLYKSAN